MLKKMFGAFGARVHNNLLMVLSIEPSSRTRPPPSVFGGSIHPPPPPEVKTRLPQSQVVDTPTVVYGSVDGPPECDRTQFAIHRHQIEVTKAHAASLRASGCMEIPKSR